MSSGTRPDPAAVGRLAVVILNRVEASGEYPRLVESTRLYPECWATFTGYPIISRFDLQDDAGPLFVEAMRVLSLKAAVFQLSGGDEEAAELMVSAPVDEMVHAVLAQYTLCVRMTVQLGIEFVHMTDRERFGWNPGDYTYQCYLAAGWGEPNPRYWIGSEEAVRRIAILSSRYESIGIHQGGRVHTIEFVRPRLVAAG